MERLAGDDAPHVMGVYIAMVRLVAVLERSLREGGIIRWHTGAPATVEQIADLLNLPVDSLDKALTVLTAERVGLIRRFSPQTPLEIRPDENRPDHTIPENPGASGLSVKIPGNSGTDAEDAFARFWEVYPRKIGRKDALAAFLKIAPDAPLTERIIQAVQRWSASADWLREGGRFVPNPAKWLESEGWNDEVRVVRPDGAHDCAKCRTNQITGTGIYRHDSSDSGPYWFCDTHEAESRKATK
jgi:hypothetical protein